MGEAPFLRILFEVLEVVGAKESIIVLVFWGFGAVDNHIVTKISYGVYFDRTFNLFVNFDILN